MSCLSFGNVAVVARTRMLTSAIVSVIGVGGLVAGSAHAAALVAPAGLAPGATFRYIYVTTATTAGTSTAASTYNTVASNDAIVQGYTSYNGTPLTWNALVSTNAASAGSLLPTQDAFFTPNGTKIAVSTSALFGTASAPLLAPITSSSAFIWTGTNGNGTTGKAMGTASPNPNLGVGNFTNSAWLSAAGSSPPSTALAVYAFSNELTVAVPEPMSLGAIAIAGAAVQRRRRSTRN